VLECHFLAWQKIDRREAGGEGNSFKWVERSLIMKPTTLPGRNVFLENELMFTKQWNQNQSVGRPHLSDLAAAPITSRTRKGKDRLI